LASRKSIVRGSADISNDPGAMLPLTPAQSRFLRRGAADPNHWNVSTRFTSTTAISVDLLKQALAVVIATHDALRLRFRQTDGSWRQYVQPANTDVIDEEADRAFFHFDIEKCGPTDAEDSIHEKSQKLHESLDLTNGPVLCLAHFRMAGGKTDHAVLIAHHLVVDALSLNTVLRDLQQAYAKLKNGHMITSFPRNYSFQMFCNRLRDLANEQRTIEAAERWSKMCWEEITDPPRDYPSTKNDNCNAAARVISLECEINGGLLIAHEAGYSTHELLLTAFYEAVAIWTGSNTVLFDILRHGRELLPGTINASGVVGMFLYNMPVVLKATEIDSLQKLKSITRQLRNYWGKGWAFEVVRFMTDNEVARSTLKPYPQPKILFNYQGIAARINDSDLFRVLNTDQAGTHSPRGQRDHPLAVKSTLNRNLLDIRFVYSRKIYRRESILELANSFRTQLYNLLKICGRTG
jgi:non-ribosomal peptide synthase protein (TIGR01720 family)